MTAWIFSTEPASYPWAVVEKEKTVLWDGIRGPLARKHLRTVQAGDRVWGYHGSPEKRLVCWANVVSPAVPDPKDPAWLAVSLTFDRWLEKPIPRSTLLETPALKSLPFLRIPRLSVSPVSEEEEKILLHLGQPFPPTV